MRSNTTLVSFSVIIPTRDRPELFEIALRSVLQQSVEDKQVIVVNDGSSEPHLSRYKELEVNYPGVEFYYLVHRPNGHGQSYSMNYGVSQAENKYVCFLDDDDFWTDEQYLEKVRKNISDCDREVDIHYCNQKAYFSDGSPNTSNVWVEDLIPKLPAEGIKAGSAHIVDASFLLSSKGFAHLNCSVYRRLFYNSIGGMDEGIRYECDRDIFLRAVDVANAILFSPDYNALHNIPDVQKKDNMSTLVSIYEKKIFQLRVYEKGILLAKNAAVIDQCLTAKSYELKNIAEALAKESDFKRASFYAKEALLNKFSFKWLLFSVYLSMRALFQ